jgi:hypothetical protein
LLYFTGFRVWNRLGICCAVLLLVLASLIALAATSVVVPRPAQIAGRPNAVDRVFTPDR